MFTYEMLERRCWQEQEENRTWVASLKVFLVVWMQKSCMIVCIVRIYGSSARRHAAVRAFYTTAPPVVTFGRMLILGFDFFFTFGAMPLARAPPTILHSSRP
mmetsp:Transcript_48192/g.81110  ORF Transcript_48192/g.81110 Transcript_48192/m.81110 type:complete len:102 (+) Transcript_48192:521-826(+)